MAEHLIPITIAVDDETIENKTIEYASKVIGEEVMKATHKKLWGGKYDSDDFSPILSIVDEKVSDVIKNHEDEIVKEAIKVVAEKLCKTKKCKEILAQLVENEE